MTGEEKRVLLRNGRHAMIEGRGEQEPFVLRGYVEEKSFRTPDLWTEDGFWRADKTEHALDIVGVYLPDGTMEGVLVRHKPTTQPSKTKSAR